MDSVTRKALEEQASKLLSGYDAAKEEAMSVAKGSWWDRLWSGGDDIGVPTGGKNQKFAEVLLGSDIPLDDTQISINLDSRKNMTSIV